MTDEEAATKYADENANHYGNPRLNRNLACSFLAGCAYKDVQMNQLLEERDKLKEALEMATKRIRDNPGMQFTADECERALGTWNNPRHKTDVVCDCSLGFRGPGSYTCKHGITTTMTNVPAGQTLKENK